MVVIKKINSKSCSPKLLFLIFHWKDSDDFVIYIFESSMLPYFEDLALCLFTKHNKFQRICLIFTKKVETQ